MRIGESDNKLWYVLYVNTRHEKKVLEKFIDQGLESYVPMRKTLKQWSDRKKVVEEPLFTGYVFVKLLPHELDRPLYVAGVINYLVFGRQKAIVKQSEIDSLRYLTENGYSLSADSSDIKVGTKVKLLLSGFRDEIAIVQNIKQKSAVVFFESLNQFIRVKLPMTALEKHKA